MKDDRRIGPWRVHTERAAYENAWIKVVESQVTHPDGSPGLYGVVRFKNRAIGILPIDADGMVWLVGQHRFPIDAYGWELPEGGGPLDEEPIAAARRELAEETGLMAQNWITLASCDLSNSVTDEEACCFLAWNLSKGESAPEASEALSLRRVAFSELLEDVLAGRIRDSLTVIMTLTAYVQAERGAIPAEAASLLLGSSR